jgi:23S rRNA (pseudouridine1915-N3)-methyltransferase
VSSWDLVAVDKLRSPHYAALAADYSKRVNRYQGLKTYEVKASAFEDPHKKVAEEAERIQKILDARCVWVILDENGILEDTSALAVRMGKHRDAGERVSFILGGAYGVSGDLKKKARYLLSLSPLTMSHELARVVWLEQLYRTLSLLHGAPYHHGVLK